MKILARHLLILLALCLAPAGPLLAEQPAPASAPAIPPGLLPPPGQVLAHTVEAKGVQIYECRPTAGDPAKYEWVFKAPEAELTLDGRRAGRHYAGPTWELADGSKVVGKVKAKADAPDGKGIPWLLVEATQATPGTMLTKPVRSIQRINTVGGQAPAEEATQAKAGQERRADYTATYRFYTDKP